MPLRFILALHNHQPIGNFEHVFENTYRESYAPFLEMLESYPDIPISLHTSGCLMEWLVDRHPEYIDRLKGMVARGQVEIMGGGFYEPILPMIPPADRLGQITSYTRYLEQLFPCKIRGMWVPERVWEQHLVRDIAEAGIAYTVVDDYHFKQAGWDESRLFHYYLSEEDGRLLRIFPGSERMRYLVPFRNPEETIAFFREVAGKHSDPVIVFADDGEKFGSWPETYRHCYLDGWLRRFFDALTDARSWVQFRTFAQVLDETPPVGAIYLPDCSYREMTEWALPVEKARAYYHLVHELEHDPRFPEIRRFLRGGNWRNFRVKYTEAGEMYGRMLQVSRRCAAASAEPGAAASGDRCESGPLPRGRDSGKPFALSQGERVGLRDQALQELYRAQCNCAWWHGAFGGLYLPHLRQAVYRHLIAADNLLLAAERRGADWTDVVTADLDIDGGDEVCLQNQRLSAYFHPRRGGALYELDLRAVPLNLLATLARRPEAYHDTILRHASADESDAPSTQSIHDRVVFKHSGLDKLLFYDPYPRKSLIDHFYDPGTTLDDLSGVREIDHGDFATGRYEHHATRGSDGSTLLLSRSGRVAGVPVRVTKTILLRPEADRLEIVYRLEGLVPETARACRFAVEFQFAGMAAGADDRYLYHDGQPRAGQLQTLHDLPSVERIGLVDQWLGLDASLRFSRPAGVWVFPIQTVSQSEAGFELVHQSTTVLPHWRLEPDQSGAWEVRIDLDFKVTKQ